MSRAGFYRGQDEGSTRAERDMDLRDAIQRIALKWPCYGRPRITAESKHQGWRMGPNRVRRIMREDNLLCARKRKFVVTTDSGHDLKVYPNLKRGMELSGINQLWVADITYIRLEREFVYLAVVMDAFSRRVIGWALDRSPGGRSSASSAAHGLGATPAGFRPGASFRPGQPVRLRRLYRSV